MSNLFIQIRNDEIINVLVADDTYIRSQPRPHEFVQESDIFGSKTIGSTRYEDGIFYSPQPHEMWIRDGLGGWKPPVEKPNAWQHLTISGHFGSSTDNIAQLANFISMDVADQIKQFAESVDEEQWSTETSSSTLVLFSDDIKSKNIEIWSLIKGLSEQVAIEIEKKYNVRVGEPRIAITRMAAGAFQVPHPDKRRDAWVYEDTFAPDNDLTAVMYYNDDFEGGELFFPQHDVAISPSQGLVVMYPGDNEFLHGVKEIISGVRYTTPLFFPIMELLD